MRIVRFAIDHPVTIIMVFVSLVAIGVVSARLLPLEYFPAVDVPFIAIQIPYQGSTPAEVEREIARPAEEVLATLSGIKRLDSRSSESGANIEIIFDWGEDVAIKAVEARERVEAIRDQLPADVRRINVFKFNFTDQPVLRLRISSERDLSGAYDMLMRKLVRPLERIPGVARVDLEGVEPHEIRIELIADRIVSHGIDLVDLERKLRQVNFSDSAGLIRDNETRYRVNPKGEFGSVDEIRDLVITDEGLRLSDIAEINYGSQRRTYARHLDRKYAIGISVYKENGANLVDVGERALAEVERIGESPEMQGIKIFSLDNQGDSVRESLSDLLSAGLLGGLLAQAGHQGDLADDEVAGPVQHLSLPVAQGLVLGQQHQVLVDRGHLDDAAGAHLLGVFLIAALPVSIGVDGSVAEDPEQLVHLPLAGHRPHHLLDGPAHRHPGGVRRGLPQLPCDLLVGVLELDPEPYGLPVLVAELLQLRLQPVYLVNVFLKPLENPVVTAAEDLAQ